MTEYGRRDCAECPLCRKNIEIQMTCDLKAAAEEQEVIEVVPVQRKKMLSESEEEDDVSVESNEILLMVDGSIRTTDVEEQEQPRQPPRQPRAAYRWATEGEYVEQMRFHADTSFEAEGEDDIEDSKVTELVMENFTRDTSLEDIVANLPNLKKLMLKNGGTHLTGNLSCLERLEHLVDVSISYCDEITGDVSVVSRMRWLFSYVIWTRDTTDVTGIGFRGTCPAAARRAEEIRQQALRAPPSR